MRQKVLLFFFSFVSPLIFPSDSHTEKQFSLDLRFPVYFVTEPSFFLGCEQEAVYFFCGNDPECVLRACEKRRADEVKKGTDDWFKHFVAPTRPQVFVVASRQAVPWDAKNFPIHLRIEPGTCDDRNGGKSAACYSAKDEKDPAIIYFEDATNVYPLIVAHEFGHALGYNHWDVPKTAKGRSVESIMTPIPSAEIVLPWDLEVVCRIHPECPPWENNW